MHEKITGQSIIRRGSMFSSRRFSVDPDSPRTRRISSLSVSSYAVEGTHRRISLQDASSSLGNPSFSSMDDGSCRTPRPLETLQEEAGESMPRQNTDKKALYDVTRTSSDGDDDVFVPRLLVPDTRRPSILKFPPGERSPSDDKRGPHHVQFNES